MLKQVRTYLLTAIFILGHAHLIAQELASSKTTYKPGERIVILFSGGPGNAKDWVGIYKEGQTPGDDGSTQWTYVDGKTSGELVFDPLPLGKYEAHLLENDGYEKLASTSFEVSEEVDVPKVSLSKAEYESGEEIEISFSGGPGNKLDWIGVYQEGQEEISLWWYVDGTKDGNVGKASGVITVQLDLAVGSYKASLFENDDVTVLATTSFNIKEAPVVNKAPVVVEQSVEVNEDGTVSITLTGSDEDGDDLTFTVLSQPKNGTLSGTAPALSYSPKANYSESDSFTFRANDGKADSNTSTVTISVVRKPKLNLPRPQFKQGEKVVISFTGGRNSKDWVGIYKEGQSPGAVPSTSWLYLDGTRAGVEGKSSGQLTFTSLPVGNYQAYLLENNQYNVLATVGFNVIEAAAQNRAPTVFDQSVSINEDESASITLVGSDQDADKLKFKLLIKPKHGILRGTLPNITYTPIADFSGTDNFTFKANDGQLDSNISNVTINIVSVNDKPIVAEQNVDVEKNGTILITLKGNDRDGDKLSFTLLSQPKNGTLSGTAPDLTYSPKPNYSGSDSFSYKANDGSSDSNPGTITIKTLSSTDTWTILIYGHGDHNLSDSLITDMMEMEQVGSNENFKIVLQADFNPKCWEPGYKYFKRDLYSNHNQISHDIRNNVSRYMIEKNESEIQGQLYTKPLQILPEKDTNMDDPEVLQAFIDWGIDTFPSERYALILWNHGSQYDGYGGDWANGTMSKALGFESGKFMIKTAAIRKSIESALTETNVDRFDFISFDTCLMGGTEILLDFEGLCDVFIACSEIDYGNGWDYNSTLNYLKKFPNLSPIEFAEKEVEFWDAHHSSAKADINFKTHAAYDMVKYQEFNNSFKLFAAAVLERSKSDVEFLNNSTFAGMRREAVHYDNAQSRANKGTVVPTNYIDLGLFAEEMAKVSHGNLKAASEQLALAVDNMVVAKAVGNYKENVSGLSIFYPYNGRHPNWKYEDINFNDPKYGGDTWVEFLYQVEAAWSKDQQAPILSSFEDSSKSGRGTDFHPEASIEEFVATFDEPAIMEFEVSNGEDAYEAYAFLVTNEFTENPNEYIYLGEIISGKLDGNGIYEFEWDATMPVISSVNSQSKSSPIVGEGGLDKKELSGSLPLYLGGWTMESGSNMFISFADYQSPESLETVPLIIITEFDENGVGKIDTILEDKEDTWIDEGEQESPGLLSSTSSGIEFEPGGKLWPVYYMEEWIEEDGEYEPWLVVFEDEYIEIPEEGKEGLEISFQDVEAGDYSVEIVTVDHFNNYSDVLEYFVRVPSADEFVTELPKLTVALEQYGAGTRIVLSWPVEAGATLQWTERVGGEWIDVPFGEIDGQLYKERVTEDERFYRLIKR